VLVELIDPTAQKEQQGQSNRILKIFFSSFYDLFFNVGE
jgi:hypothetical protein